MEIRKAIQKADDFYANAYSLTDKLDWCSELTASICNEIKKIYDSQILMPSTDNTYLLPPGCEFENIEYIFLDGKQLTKTDCRSFGLNEIRRGYVFVPSDYKEVRIVFTKIPAPYRYYTASCICKDNYLYIPENVTIDAKVGDCICADDKIVYALDLDAAERRIIVEKGCFGTEERKINIERIITEETEIPIPYDGAYVDYILGKIAYYQNDIDEYNKHMTSVNSKLESYATWYKQRNPVDKNSYFKNYW